MKITKVTNIAAWMPAPWESEATRPGWVPSKPVINWSFPRFFLWLYKKALRLPKCAACGSWNTSTLGEWGFTWGDCNDCGAHLEGEW